MTDDGRTTDDGRPTTDDRRWTTGDGRRGPTESRAKANEGRPSHSELEPRAKASGQGPAGINARSHRVPDLPEHLVAIGRIVAAHGIRGDVKVRLETDFPERLVPGRTLLVGDERRRIIRARVDGDEAVIAFAGIGDRTAAEALRGLYLAVAEVDLPPLEPDTYYHHQLVGLRVEDAAGLPIGVLREVMTTGANDVYVVDVPDGELLLPAIEDVIKAIDLPAGRMVVELLPGLEPVRRPRSRLSGQAG